MQEYVSFSLAAERDLVGGKISELFRALLRPRNRQMSMPKLSVVRKSSETGKAEEYSDREPDPSLFWNYEPQVALTN